MARDKHQLGDKPIEPKHHDVMNALARGLDEALNGEKRGKDRDNGFVLLVFPFAATEADGPRCNFISNGADRRDIVALFKEMIARFEGQSEMKGRA